MASSLEVSEQKIVKIFKAKSEKSHQNVKIYFLFHFKLASAKQPRVKNGAQN